MAAQLTGIRIYPVKSLDPVELNEAEVGLYSLRYDREFAMLTPDGKFMNGKRSGRVNELAATFDLAARRIRLMPRAGGATVDFHLDDERQQIAAFLSDFFGMPVLLAHSDSGQLMDMPRESSLTLVSSASLKSLQADMAAHHLDELRLRFRANLEISGTAAYREEELFGDPENGVRFRLGEVEMVGVGPRARCNVPPRNPFSGIPDSGFVKLMVESRKKSLPRGSRLPLFGGFYHLTVNVFLPPAEQGKMLRVGDRLEVLGTVPLNSL